jgi:hypothetical protein
MSETSAQPPKANEPSDSSNARPVTTEKAKKEKKGNRSKKTDPVDPKAPVGSIPVPPPKSAPAKQPSHVVTAAVPITGWGDSDFTTMHKRQPLLDHEPDASGFFDLVDAVYTDLAARQTSMKFIPRSLYRYYCGQLWWYRVLYVHKSNGFILETQQKRFLDTIGPLEDLVLPDKIAQYLANLGNFDYNGEVYRMKLPHLDFSATGTFQNTVIPGQLHTGSESLTPDEFWYYAQFPVPATLLTSVLNELVPNTPGTRYQPFSVGTKLPSNPEFKVYATENVCGYTRNGWQASHSSWASTFANLGWTLKSFPRDMQTDYQSSPSTMSWISSRLALLSSEKMLSVKQLTLTKQGNFCQIGYLDTHANDLRTHATFDSVSALQDYRYTTSQYFFLAARSALPPAVLSATYCFGYRVKRYSFGDSGHTNSAPFAYYNTTSKQIAPLPPGYLTAMNRSLDGLNTDLTAARYMTFAQERSVVLVSALL